MILVYNNNGKVVYKFEALQDLKKYFLSFSELNGKELLQEKQLAIGDYLFELDDTHKNTVATFYNLINQVVGDLMIDENKIGWELDSAIGVSNISYLNTYNFQFGKPAEFNYFNTSILKLVIENLIFRGGLDEPIKKLPKFAKDFGYPQKKFMPVTSSVHDSPPQPISFDIRNMHIEKLVESRLSEDGGKYDKKGNSSHYQSQFMEFIRDQERKYGTIVAMLVCQSNVDKYNQRAGLKEGVTADKDLTKRDWYLSAVKHFSIKINAFKADLDNNVEGRNKYVGVPEEVIDLLRAEFGRSLEHYPEYVPLAIAIEK
jgi:hypothetical protein